MLDSKHDHSAKCSKAGCICSSVETQGDENTGYSKLDSGENSEGDEKRHLIKVTTVEVTET